MPKIELVILHSGGLRSLISLASAVTQTQAGRFAAVVLGGLFAAWPGDSGLFKAGVKTQHEVTKSREERRLVG